MFKAEEVRGAFPEGVFGAPTAPEAIATAERLLGHSLPEQIRDLYLAFDGFRGPADALFFLPLLECPSPCGESLVTYTLFFRNEDYSPRWLRDAIVVGDNGTGAAWFILLDEGCRLVRWDAEWEEYELVEGNLLEAWCRERKLYGSRSLTSELLTTPHPDTALEFQADRESSWLK
jgi:hypothetical protein